MHLAGLMVLLWTMVTGGVLCITLAPLMVPKDASLVIPDKYIVVFKDADTEMSAQTTSQASHASWLQTRLSSAEETTQSKLEHAFSLDHLSGYTGYFSPALIDEIRGRDEVQYVEADQLMYAMHMDRPDDAMKQSVLAEFMQVIKGPVSGRRSDAKWHDITGLSGFNRKSGSWLMSGKGRSQSTSVTQMDAPWGLARLSHNEDNGSGTGNGNDIGNDGYKYPSSAGANVDVYIVDTGINVAHEEFEGRATWGATIPLFDLDIDGNGHGTHCAGTIGSRTFGVAKRASLVAVKVLRTSGFGTNSDVIKGVEWVTRRHRRNFRRHGRRAVANMSLGGGRSLTLETAVNRAVDAGVHFSVAAGNDSEDACEYSPAAASGPITVGASTATDTLAYFSNHGSCVDILAPGLDIKSTWIGSPDAVNTISGTSMAAPHVAGVLALYLGEDGEKNWTPAELKEELKRRAQADRIATLPSGTPNLLVNTLHLLSMLSK